MPGSEFSIDLTNDVPHRMSKNHNRSGRAPAPVARKRKPLDAAPAAPALKRPATKVPVAPTQHLPPPRPGDSFAAPVCRPQLPWSGYPAQDDASLTSSDEEPVCDRGGDLGSTQEVPAHDGSAVFVIDSVEEVDCLLKTRDILYIENENGKVWLVESEARYILDLSHMTLKVLLDILDALHTNRARALDLSLTCSVPGRIVAARITDQLADIAPNVNWPLILPWIDEDCQTQKPCDFPLPEPKPFIQALFSENTDKEDKLLLRATNNSQSETPASSASVTALDILAIYEPPNPYWNKPDRKTAERQELRIAILRKAVDVNIEDKKKGLIKRAVDWLERLFGVRELERTFAQELKQELKHA
ncbi:hypothetical protein HDU87_006727 [Geranomyces variabilis]|uniref:Uncharacterized protein n=1 Tax=Geranomyces variabilis TaxID=109894 RepID=A0AAD5TRV9_9FUNG|nr:hypothetical protein HDU87_006727 [Geranomyces variabilis]